MQTHGRPNSGLCAVTIVVLLGLAFAPVGRAEEPFLEKTRLFSVGDDPAYLLYHIPGVVLTARGTVLAWCEARKRAAGVSDWDDIRILLRRSVDDGRTWSPPVSVADVPGPKAKNPFALRMKNVDSRDVTYNNPVLIAGRDGTVHMLFCLEYERCFHQRSTDDGVSWSAPTEITAAFAPFRDEYDWKVLATGPNHGIQLASGRLLVPVWLSTGTGGNAHRPSVTATIFSDDDGRTWRAGEIAVPCTEEWVNPNETAAVELADGRVMLNVRSESHAHRRLVTTSADGATGWSRPAFDAALVEPICMAGLVRHSLPEGGRPGRILFSNPDNLSRADGKVKPGASRDRRNLTVKASEDEGRSWPVSRVLEAGPSMYSDLAVTPAGTILCFYGSGEGSSFAGAGLTLARFNLAWLLDEANAAGAAAAQSPRPGP
jgi:sialidase-1